MFAVVVSVLIVFVQRSRYAGVGLLALGRQAFILALVGAALLAGARLTIAAQLPTPTASPAPSSDLADFGADVTPPSDVAPEAAGGESAAQGAEAPVPAASASAAAPVPAIASAVAAVGSGGAPLPSASGGVPSGAVPALEIANVTARGLLEADARGGVTRRMDRLQACLTNPKNRQSGELTLKVNIDGSGSVANSKPTGGDLLGKPLGDCLVLQFYKMGFAAPASDNAGFDITLRAP
jgi:hypothetical protein